VLSASRPACTCSWFSSLPPSRSPSTFFPLTGRAPGR